MTCVRCLVGHNVTVLTNYGNFDGMLLYIDEANGGLLNVLVEDQHTIIKSWFAIVPTDIITKQQQITQLRITHVRFDPEHQYMNITSYRRKEIIARLNFERQQRNRRRRKNLEPY
jgi:hypothetical protein